MPPALAASRDEGINRPSTDSASSLSSSALWLAGEKAIKNSGKAIISAAWFFASLIKASAVRRFSFLTVEDWICATATLLIFVNVRSGVIVSTQWNKFLSHAIQVDKSRQARR